MPEPKLPLDNSRRQSVQSTTNEHLPSGSAPPLQLVMTSAVGQYFYGLPVQANTSRQNASVFTPPISSLPPSTASAMPPRLNTPAMSAGSQPVGAHVRLTPKMIEQWLREKFRNTPPPASTETKEYLEKKAGRKLNGIYVLASLCYIYGCDTYAPVQPTEEDYRQVSAINDVLLTADQVMTPDEICRSLSTRGELLTFERVCQLLELMRGIDLIYSIHVGAIGKNSMVARSVNNNGARGIALKCNEPLTVTAVRFILNHLKDHQDVPPSWMEVNKHVKVSNKTYSFCVSAICGHARCWKPDLMRETNETPPGSQAPHVSSTKETEKIVKRGTGTTTRKNWLEVSSGPAARTVAAASPEKSETYSVVGDPPPPPQFSFVGPSGLPSSKRRFDDTLAEMDSFIKEINGLYPLSEYDPASELTWYRQGPDQCLEASLWNLFSREWIKLPPAEGGQQSTAGELQQACFDAQGFIRKAPDGSPIELLFVTQRMLGPLAQMLETLPSGFILYLGDTTRLAAQRNGVPGHYVAMRRVKDQWYLIDSQGNGPAKVNLADYLRKLPHGLMAAIPVSPGVKNSSAWKTLQAMAASPRLESLSIMLNFDRTPQDILEWLEARRLFLGDLSRPDVVADYLSDTTGQPWDWEPMKLPDTQAGQPWRTENQSHIGQGNNASGQEQGTNPVDTLLDKLDASGRDLCVLCLKAQPFHLLAYRRDGNWFCKVEPPSAPRQDVYSPNLIEQPLHQVMAAYLAEVGRLQADMPPDMLSQAEAVAQRTELDIVLQKPPAATR